MLISVSVQTFELPGDISLNNDYMLAAVNFLLLEIECFFFSTHHARCNCAGAGVHVVHSNRACTRRSVNSVWCAMLCTCSHKNWEMRSK